MDDFDFNGTSILSCFQGDRVAIEGKFRPDELAQRLIEEWIPFYECHRCGRHSYCRYARPIPDSDGRYEDIRCGVAEDVVKNFVTATFSLLDEAPQARVQAYLDGAFHLCRFVYWSELTIGGCISQDFVQFLNGMAPSFFGNITHLREHLNQCARHFREVPEFHSTRSVIFLEGRSEKQFVSMLAQSGWWPYSELLLEDYEGKGNRRRKRIEMLLSRYHRDGYNIYIQADADGSGIESLSLEQHVPVSGTFIFQYDFESSIPAAVLHSGLELLGATSDVSLHDFERVVDKANCSVIPLIRMELGIDIEPIKVPLASAIGSLISSPRSNLWGSDVVMNSELGGFLRFLEESYC